MRDGFSPKLIKEKFERIILRKIYGPSCVNGVWRIKYNDELYSLYKEPNTVKIMKIARLN